MSDHERLTGWMFTDAVRQADCPRCGAKAGDRCRMPSGRRKWPPHTERLTALVAKEGLGPYTRR